MGESAHPHQAFMVTGAAGMLGTALVRSLTARGVRCEPYARAALDVTDAAAVTRAVSAFAGSLHGDERGVIVNAAAYTDVERAEDEPQAAFAVNETGARTLARAAREAGLSFVHVSTDFVFDGEKCGPYLETDVPHPLSVYGRSKLAGERAVAEELPDALIVRTAWVYSWDGGPYGRGFPAKVIARAGESQELRVVTDEIGSPSYAPDLAEGIVALAQASAHGTVHLAGSGSCSRFELAVATLSAAGMSAEVLPVSSGEFPTKARRPANAVLECARAKTWGVTMPQWKDALAQWVRAWSGSAEQTRG